MTRNVVTSNAIVFPAWARFALGCLIAVIAYLVSGEYINITEEARTLISGLIVLFGSVGVVPPTPATLPAALQSPAVRFGLLVAVLVLTYVVQAAVSMDDLLRGLIQAVLALVASVGIVPPEAEARRPAA